MCYLGFVSIVFCGVYQLSEERKLKQNCLISTLFFNLQSCLLTNSEFKETLHVFKETGVYASVARERLGASTAVTKRK